ncbi:prolyl oligopeptidase family serine peptidase [Chryseobacterium wangxinyae]|uniref:alpha/beta hydrolase family protein n=1 Tax=Chryseobacterium sp. CY350 TaxID=2997336 RepID=UPI00226E9A20|nr:prolyl oligopeptidase family serine peptidase [Chryseobacterium sp. CY350]MCY0976862.1 prolyl oligopeptidase family serine peptidase [Chryseobacterium sp. CY350]WBZ96861.1 prolyl oligopeptidase family serine peptidase [Chryseobacterium sp. CY350]
MRVYCCIIMLFFVSCYKAQKTISELDQWMSHFSTMIGQMKVSDDQRFVLLTKMYANNSDSVFVFDRQSAISPSDTILKNSNISFLNNHTVFASGEGGAKMIDLETKKREIYSSIQRCNVNESLKQYVILGINKNLKVYNAKGKVLHHEAGTLNYTISEQGQVYILAESGGIHKILRWNGSSMKLLYSTATKIIAMDLLESGRFIVLKEKEKTDPNGKIRITLLRISDGQLFNNNQISLGKDQNVKVTEAGHSESFLIDIVVKKAPKKVRKLDIWYGGDEYLRNKDQGWVEHQYIVWNIKNNEVYSIPFKARQVFLATENPRYFWTYNIKEENDYRGFRSLNIYRYDILKNKSELIFENTSEMVVGKDGRYTIGFLMYRNQWMVYDHLLEKTKIIDYNKTLSYPIFMPDGSLLFTGENRLINYHLKTSILKTVFEQENSKVSFYEYSGKMVHQMESFKITRRTAEMSQPLALHIRREDRNDSGYYSYYKGKLKEIMPYSSNRIKMFFSKDKQDLIYAIEENYNLSPQLYSKSKSSDQKQILYNTNCHDKETVNLRQDVISYTNSGGKHLKGVLYYPIKFDSTKKYPMVVQVYSIQHDESNKYLYPVWGSSGFNIRLLLQNGYMVFQPDIVSDGRGPGISALDCIHSGLDAIQGNVNIDFKRIGLTGHSFGGYETNFIATHSERFAAYVSGAGLSDIVNTYFSFNELFKIADYSRFETGQFSMGVPFSEDKDLYYKNNPINFIEKVSAPVLLWAGKKDTNIPPTQTMSFYMGLLRNKKRVVVLMYSDQEHTIKKNSDDIKDLNTKIIEWWDYHLKSMKDMKWIDKEMKRDAE